MKPTLLVLAAGMGSRYGGLKQIDPVGPNGETIIDYSIYDAIKAGFGKVVFVIRRDIETAFKEFLGQKYQDQIEITFAFQEIDALPDGFNVPEGRVKPWGTGHAILVAKAVVNEPFLVINGDDFYGRGSFNLAAEFLSQKCSDSDYCMIAYKIANTLSEFGSVSRGICQTNEEGCLESIEERTKISIENGEIIDRSEGNEVKMKGDEVTSMNMLGFSPSLFDHLESQFTEFLEKSGQEEKSEFYIPSVCNRLINEGKIKMHVVKSDESWFGVTYKEDKKSVMASIQKLIEKGVYPKN